MKAQPRRLSIITAICLCSAGLGRADLAGRINAIISQPSQKNVQFSIHVVKADSGQTIYSHNATEPLIPASNMKIIVSAAALRYLGPDYVYKTQVGLVGDTLVIVGSGDPLLGDATTDAKYNREQDWIFKDIVAALKHRGLTAINNIAVDTSVFDDQRVHPSWPRKELNRWYACEVSGLNFNDNCVQLTVKNISGQVTVLIEPQTSYVALINKVIPTLKGDSVVGSYRTSTPNKLIVHGRCRKQGGPFDVAIQKPAGLFAFMLAERLAQAGIQTRGKIVDYTLTPEANIKTILEFNTPLTDCLARCNKNSLGLAAEALLKTIAAHSQPNKKGGSWAKGRQVISQHLSKLGIQDDEFYIDDGSGLSRKNKLSANAITTVLSDVYRSGSWTLYMDSLAVGGVDGTIRRYFKEEEYNGKILGKTGYLSGVKSFSGVCTTDQGDYIFSILTNKANGGTREVINDIAKAIVDGAEGPTSGNSRGGYVSTSRPFRYLHYRLKYTIGPLSYIFLSHCSGAGFTTESNNGSSRKSSSTPTITADGGDS